MNTAEVAELFSFSKRTVERRERASDVPLSVNEADLVFRIARTTDLAVEMIGDRHKGLTWMRRKNTALGGAEPLATLRTEIGASEVERVLTEIAYGGPA